MDLAFFAPQLNFLKCNMSFSTIKILKSGAVLGIIGVAVKIGERQM